MKKTFYLAILLALLVGLLVPTAAFAERADMEQDWLCERFGIGCEEPTPTPAPTEPPPEPTDPPVDAPPPPIDAMVDVIIQTDGQTGRLVSYIRGLGGKINFEYKNVPAVAASVPASTMVDLSNFSDVTKIEKDRMFYLHDELDGGKNDVHPNVYAVENMAGVEVKAVDLAEIDASVFPEGYVNFLYTGADLIWDETGAGEGSIVAVVDTGTAPIVCLSEAVIGAPGFPDGYNATGDGVPATSFTNHYHGTHVGGVIASACALSFSDPSDPLYQAIATHIGWLPDFVPIFGQAPGADIYPVKVFPESGAGSPTSVILDGLDHILTLKKSGDLDIDIVNMSLGGPTVWDGLDAFDRFVVELAFEHILVVTSASNGGPIPNSMGSPATSFGSISVGALDYGPSSRVLYEYVGLTRFPLAPGQGLVMRPDDIPRVVNFSGRGPMSDGRIGVDISALGHWTFHVGPDGSLRWAGGTSFSSPGVAGAAALLNAYWEGKGKETSPFVLRNVLLRGADPKIVGSAWRDRNTQGHGALDVPKAFKLLKRSPWRMAWGGWSRRLRANILPRPVQNKTDTWTSGVITLDPSVNKDFVFEISKYTSNVTIEVFDIVAPDNSSYAYWPNALEVHLQSAKRTDWGDHPVQVYWYPHLYGGSFDIVVEDGLWTFWDIPWVDQPMEPGLMKLSLIGDYSNESPVSFKVRVTRENNRVPLSGPVASGWIKMGESYMIPVEVPADTNIVTFDLDWDRKWDMFPTSDIDMLVYDPSLGLVSFAGATGNAPERVVVSVPEAGTWYVQIDGYEMYLPDFYELFVMLE